MNSAKRQAPTCKICMEKPAIYRCPQCRLETCSIICGDQHKADDKCSGRALEIDQKRIAEMNDDDIAKDFRFLEKVGRTIECSARLDAELVAEKFGLAHPGVHTKSRHGNGGFRLIRQKAEECHIILKTAPSRFQRRKENTTCLSNSKNNRKIRWRCHYKNYLLPNAVCDKADKAVSHDTTLRQMIEPQVPGTVNLDDVVVLLEDFSRPCHLRGYLALELDRRLKDSLADTIVIEFPTFYLVNKSDLRPLDENSELTSTSSSSECETGESELSTSDDEDDPLKGSEAASPITSDSSSSEGEVETVTVTGAESAIETCSSDDDVQVQESISSPQPLPQVPSGECLGSWRSKPVYRKQYRADAEIVAVLQKDPVHSLADTQAQSSER